MAARMTPSRLGSRGRPPRLGRGMWGVARAVMAVTLDNKARHVPELGCQLSVQLPGRDGAGAARLPGTRQSVSHPARVGTICGGVCGCRQNWEVPGPATRALMATSIGHVLPTISRLAKAMGMTVHSAPQLVDVVDDRGGRTLDLLFQRLARELTGAETEAVRIATDPAVGQGLSARLLGAPTLA